eukprot:scaffold2687_cov120-Skeletonema_dohrnii-CCMP3373.AAC.2
MDLDTQIDPSPLITRKFSSRLSSIGGDDHDYNNEQSSITLTDFQRTASDAHISENSSSSIWRERILHPCTSMKIYFDDLSSFFSWRFLSWLAIQNFAMYGGVSALVMSVSLPLFKEMGIDASKQQLYSTMTLSPFALKPFIGVFSDLFPIKGYHKRYLALISILIGLIGCSTLIALYHNRNAKEAALDPGTAYRLSDLLVICFFCMNVTAANLDILGEGKYSEIMRKHPESGSSVITFKFACSLLGSIVTNSYVGPLTDGGHFHIIFCIALGLLLTPFYPTLRGWLPEKKRRKSDPGMTKICCGCLFDQGSFQKKRTPFIVIALSGLAVPLLSAVTTFASLGIGIGVSMIVLLILATVTYVVFPRVVFRIIVAIMLIKISHIKLGGVLGYYYTADAQCLPDGPHFSYTYYITVAGIVGSIVNLIAVMLYQTYLSSCRFRPALMCTILAGAIAPIMDIILIKRWNHVLGISDKVFFILGSAIFEHFVNIVVALPMMVIFGKLAPPNMESAVFSYAVGIATFCFMMSQLWGSAIIKWSSMKTVGTDCNFDELPAIIGVCQILLPIIVGIPATLLIPNRLQTEPLIDWTKERWYEEQEKEENITESLTRVLEEESAEQEEGQCTEEVANEHLFT